MILGGELGRDQRDPRLSTSKAGCGPRWKATDQKQAAWRTDPSKSGAAGAFGDIATHAYNLGRYMTGVLPESSQLQFEDVRRRSPVGRLRYRGDSLRKRRTRNRHRFADQPRSRERFGNRNRRHQRITPLATGEPERIDLPAKRQAASDLHPRSERSFHECVGCGRLVDCRRVTPKPSSKPLPTSTPRPLTTWPSRAAGETIERRDTIYPNVYDGVEGMYFIQQCVDSSARCAWLPLKHAAARP